MALDDALAGYVAAALKHGEATEAGDSAKANESFRVLDQNWNRIRTSNSEWPKFFLELLTHSSPWVRLWGASHAIQIDPERATPVLQALSTEEGLLGFSAQMTLEAWQRGQLGERN